MKKLPTTESLDLSKEIVASLTNQQLQEIEGGLLTHTVNISCITNFNSCIASTEAIAE